MNRYEGSSDADGLRAAVGIMVAAGISIAVAVAVGVVWKRAEAAPPKNFQQERRISEDVYRVYDMEHGVACYYRYGTPNISCVRVGP